MEYIIAEARSLDPVISEDGHKLYCARALDFASDKHIAITEILEREPCSYFLRVGQFLANFLGMAEPLVFVTDWSDPCELKGLRLDMNNEMKDYPTLAFFAFYTDWDDISASGIENLFAHEFSHVWMYWLGMDYSLSRTNRFHTVTAITDNYLAFSEGFAEFLEIVSKDVSGYMPKSDELWDSGYDSGAWLCKRDQQLRYHAVKNNRFIYHTALPYDEDFEPYSNLHLMHITSTAFTPERIKNGSQMMASEGVIASIFYHIYTSKTSNDTFQDSKFYAAFGADSEQTDPTCCFLLKILYAMSKIDLNKPSLMTDFIRSYGECFPAEKEDLYNIFCKITHFATVSNEARKVFCEIYRIGRQGIIPRFREMYKEQRNPLVEDLQARLLTGKIPLDAAVCPEIWMDGNKHIPPTPWEPEITVPLRININTATEVDFMSINGMDLTVACKLVAERDKRGGYTSREEFEKFLLDVRQNNVILSHSCRE